MLRIPPTSPPASLRFTRTVSQPLPSRVRLASCSVILMMLLIQIVPGLKTMRAPSESDRAVAIALLMAVTLFVTSVGSVLSTVTSGMISGMGVTPEGVARSGHALGQRTRIGNQKPGRSILTLSRTSARTGPAGPHRVAWLAAPPAEETGRIDLAVAAPDSAVGQPL